MSVTSQFVAVEHDYPVGIICVSYTLPDKQFKLDGLQKRSQLQKLLSEFTDTFSDHPGKTTSTKDKILVQPGTRPLKLPPYHGLRGSASPVLTAIGFVNGRWQFSTPHRIHTP